MSTSNSLLLAPTSSHPTTHTQTSHSAPSAPGIHDTLRASLNPDSAALLNPTATTTSSTSGHTTASTTTAAPQSTHTLETRLSNYEQTRQNLQYTLLKRNYGLSAPLIREMELGIVRGGDSLGSRELGVGPGMGLGSTGGGFGRSVHEDVLRGEDWSTGGWEGVFCGGDVFTPMSDFHTEMERRMAMQW